MYLNTKALVVEDTETWQGICKRNLSKVLPKIDVATNLQEAIDTIIKQFYHIAIINLSLDPQDDENRDGMVVLRKLRLLRDETSCIVLSGTGRLEDGANALREGADEVIEKEKFDKTHFVEITDRLVSKASKNREILRSKGVEALFISSEEQYLIYRIQNLILKPGEGGYREINTLISSLIEDYFPIWRLRSPDFCRIDEERKKVDFIGWSRFNALPFLLTLARIETIEQEIEQFEQGKGKETTLLSIETTKKYKSIGGIIYSISGYDITRFIVPDFLFSS